MNQDALIIFFKPPVAGFVKTRLAKVVGDYSAAQIYGAMLGDLAEVVDNPNYDTIPMCPSHNDALTSPWSRWIPQAAGDIGKRMSCAFEERFADGYENILLIGTDIPEISSHIIATCLQRVRTHGMAIGPTTDGGYYAIGFTTKTYHKSFFSKIGWSTDKVFSETLTVADARCTSPYIGPILRDVDTYQDLEKIITELPSEKAPRLHLEWRKLHNA